MKSQTFGPTIANNGKILELRHFWQGKASYQEQNSRFFAGIGSSNRDYKGIFQCGSALLTLLWSDTDPIENISNQVFSAPDKPYLVAQRFVVTGL